MEDYQDRLHIATPEGISVDLVLAGLGSRFAAALLDLVFKGCLIILALLLASALGDFGTALFAIATFVIYAGYDIAFEVLAGGRTPGKRWTGLRVLRDDGRPVDLLASAIRNVVRLVDGPALGYLPAMVSILVTRRNQRLGDLAASTIVVREPRKRDPFGPPTRLGSSPMTAGAQLLFGGYGIPAGVGAPRPAAAPPRGTLDVSAVSAEDLAAVRGFLDRRDALPAAARGDLARRIASALAPRVGGAAAQLRDEDLIEQVAGAKARGG
jgi:uncharacterized RDD family membrane protein YckC